MSQPKTDLEIVESILRARGYAPSPRHPEIWLSNRTPFGRYKVTARALRFEVKQAGRWVKSSSESIRKVAAKRRGDA